MKKSIKVTIIIASICLTLIIATIVFLLYIKQLKKESNTIETSKILNEEEISTEDDSMFIVLPNENNIEDEYEKQEKQAEQKNNTQTKKDNNTKSNLVSNSRYFIKVNYTANAVTIYEKNENGEYNNPIKAMVCSTGTATPTFGQYSIKARWQWLKLFGNVWGHYVTQINGNILFHSVPYLEKSENTLEYWEYDKLGTTASMGCVRLKVIDAKWIYDNIPAGTIVEFYSDSNPGPLGKPGTLKISENAYRDWDPTDPNENNPWKNISNEEKDEEEIVNNIEEDIHNEEQQNETIVENTIDEKKQESNTIKNEEINGKNEIIENNVIDQENKPSENNAVEQENQTIESNNIVNEVYKNEDSQNTTENSTV